MRPANGPQPPSRETGSSLIELMMVISLVLVLLAGILTGVIAHQRQRRLTSERQLALIACRNTIEQLRDVEILTLPTLHGVGFDVPGTNGAPQGLLPVRGDADGLAGEISVLPLLATATDTLYLVSARAVWSGSGPNCDIRLECFLGARR